jgi:hypothetical protein
MGDRLSDDFVPFCVRILPSLLADHPRDIDILQARPDWHNFDPSQFWAPIDTRGDLK